MTFLYSVERRQEFEEWFVTSSFAGEADEGGDGEAEGAEVDLGTIAADDFDGFQAAETLGCGRGREADTAAELGDGEAGVGGELADELAIDGVDSGVI